MNNDSYVANPSQNAFLQTVASCKIAEDFFLSLGAEFMIHAMIVKVQRLLYEIRIDDENLFEQSIKQLQQLPKAYRKYVPFSKRIVFYVSNKYLIQTYFREAIKLKFRFKHGKR